VVVFEILSPGTSRLDRIAKAREYDNMPFVQRYVIPEQTSQAATVFTRMNGVRASVVVDGEADLAMPELGVTVPLSDLYLDVSFRPSYIAAG
jgi:Uma2 family endonuclease